MFSGGLPILNVMKRPGRPMLAFRPSLRMQVIGLAMLVALLGGGVVGLSVTHPR